MSVINIPAILIANLMGIIILFIISIGNSWQSKRIFSENKSLKIMFISCFLSCVADPVCFLADGKPGTICFYLVYGCNLWIFIGNIIVSIMWLWLISSRLNKRIPLLHRVIIGAGAAFDIGLLIVNLFVPIVFYVDKSNVYHRSDLYGVYLLYFSLVLLYGLVFYLIEGRKSGGLKYFPVWAFLIPITIGAAIQLRVYGVSTITPFMAVSLICAYINLQDEFVYRDKLTGLYNRFFLDIFHDKIRKKAKRQYSMMMLDLNAFKKINDVFGHSVGDEALINTARILIESVGSLGQVVRYAGDEFIVILNTQEDSVLEATAATIKQSLADFSTRENTPYELSVSIGCSKLPPDKTGEDDFINKIDELMYQDKREYYKSLDQSHAADLNR